MKSLQKKIIPEIKDWEKQCICKTPINPSELYVNCDICNKWYHTNCVGIKKEEAENIKEFICEICKKDGKNKITPQNMPKNIENKSKKIENKPKNTELKIDENKPKNDEKIIKSEKKAETRKKSKKVKEKEAKKEEKNAEIN